MITFLDLMVIIALVLLGGSIVAALLMFLLKNKKAKKVFLYISLVLALYLASIGLRIGFLGYFESQMFLSFIVILLVVGSIVLDVLSKKNEKFPLISRVVALIAVVFGFLSAFCI